MMDLVLTCRGWRGGTENITSIRVGAVEDDSPREAVDPLRRE